MECATLGKFKSVMERRQGGEGKTKINIKNASQLNADEVFFKKRVRTTSRNIEEFSLLSNTCTVVFFPTIFLKERLWTEMF